LPIVSYTLKPVCAGLDCELPGELWKGYGRHKYGWKPNLGDNQYRSRARDNYQYWWIDPTVAKKKPKKLERH
jgi:hypothetical protein